MSEITFENVTKMYDLLEEGKKKQSVEFDAICLSPKSLKLLKKSTKKILNCGGIAILYSKKLIECKFLPDNIIIFLLGGDMVGILDNETGRFKRIPKAEHMKFKFELDF